MRLRLVEGRLLSGSDGPTTRPVVVVNRSFAQRYLGDAPDRRAFCLSAS